MNLTRVLTRYDAIKQKQYQPFLFRFLNSYTIGRLNAAKSFEDLSHLVRTPAYIIVNKPKMLLLALAVLKTNL